MIPFTVRLPKTQESVALSGTVGMMASLGGLLLVHGHAYRTGTVQVLVPGTGTWYSTVHCTERNLLGYS